MPHLGGVLEFLRQAVRLSETNQATDRQLLHRYAGRRDEDAFAILVRRHAPMVLSACRRVLGDSPDADDAFQAAFVILSRKAGSAGWQDSVGSWLYMVAHRAARKLKQTAERRRLRESQASTSVNSETPGGDLRGVLDDELTRLPEKYRAPLVLCYLEGKTNEEAAQALGWTKGTVSGRLARARDVLRDRLMRRGVTASAVALAAALPVEAAPAAVPAPLFDTTLKATLAPTATLSAPVAATVEGVLHAMFMTRVKLVAASLVALALMATGIGGYAVHTLAHAVPLPVLPEQRTPDDGPQASEPVIRDGLSVTVRTTKAGFVGKEALSFEVTFKNVSRKAVLLNTYGWPVNVGPYTVQIDAEDVVVGPWVAVSQRKIEQRAPIAGDSRRLDAGATLTLRIVLDNDLYDYRGLVDGEMLPQRYLVPGKYHATIKFHFQANPAAKDAKDPHYLGELVTKPAVFAVVEPPPPGP
jgi:RNA polymerase sigma factor (sigma-70 family)